jgi:membrane protein
VAAADPTRGQTISLPKAPPIRGVRLFGRISGHLFVRVWNQIQADDCFDLAAQIAFYFTLSLFPFCLVLAVIISWLPSTTLWASFATWIVTYLPLQSQHLVFTIILSIVNGSLGFLSFGVIATFWSSASGFVSLMESLSLVYGMKDTRSYWHKHFVALLWTILAACFALLSFGLMTLGHWGFERVLVFEGPNRNWPHITFEFGRWVFTLILMAIAIGLLNYLLPAEKRRLRSLSPGTLFAVAMLVASSEGFNLYFEHFNTYPRIYGALAGFIILMLWIYMASLILLLGAEIDHQLILTTQESGPS